MNRISHRVFMEYRNSNLKMFPGPGTARIVGIDSQDLDYGLSPTCHFLIQTLTRRAQMECNVTDYIRNDHGSRNMIVGKFPGRATECGRATRERVAEIK